MKTQIQRQWAINSFDPKKGLGGFFFYETKKDAELFFEQEIKDATGMIQGIKEITGETTKEQNFLEKYKKEAKPVLRGSIYN